MWTLFDKTEEIISPRAPSLSTGRPKLERISVFFLKSNIAQKNFWPSRILFRQCCRSFLKNFRKTCLPESKNVGKCFFYNNWLFSRKLSLNTKISDLNFLHKFSCQGSWISSLRIQKHAKSYSFLENCLFADNAPLNTLNTVSTTLSKSFAESPKDIRCLKRLQNYTSSKNSFFQQKTLLGFQNVVLRTLAQSSNEERGNDSINVGKW